MTNALKSLLRSRKFLLSVFAVAQTLLFHYVEVDPQVWAAIDALVIVLVGAIAYEDGAAKSASVMLQTNVENEATPTRKPPHE